MTDQTGTGDTTPTEKIVVVDNGDGTREAVVLDPLLHTVGTLVGAPNPDGQQLARGLNTVRGLVWSFDQTDPHTVRLRPRPRAAPPLGEDRTAGRRRVREGPRRAARRRPRHRAGRTVTDTPDPTPPQDGPGTLVWLIASLAGIPPRPTRRTR